MQAKYKYDAFGNCTVTNSTNLHLATYNPIRYRGYYFDDETDWYFLNARYYSPEWRRFISPDDTAYLNPKNVNGCNLYCYCNNNPINYTDPMGHEPLSTTAAMILFYGMLLVLIGGTAIYLYLTEDTPKPTHPNHSTLPPVPNFPKNSKPTTPTNNPSKSFTTITANDVADTTSAFLTYAGNITHSFGGRLNNPNTYNSRYGGKYDSFNSGRYIGVGGWGSWGVVMDAFFDDIGISDID